MSAIIPLVSFLLLTIAISFQNGSFTGNLSQIYLILISFILLSFNYFFIKQEQINGESRFFIILPVVIALFAVIPGGWWLNNPKIIGLIQILSSLLIIPAVFMVVNRKISGKNIGMFFSFFLMVALILRLLMITGSPAPGIDVFAILREAPLKFLQGLNPYNTLYTHVFPGITPDYYAYWPASFFLQLPFVKIFNDPRYLLLSADLLAAFLILVLGGKNRISLILSVLYLFRPASLSITEAAWLTPLDFFLIAALVYFIYKKKNPLMAGFFLGLLTSVQFFFGIMIFHLLKYFNWNKKLILSFIITTAIFVVPFFIIDPVRFWNQTVEVYFRNPPHPSILIHTSLNLNTLYFVFTGFDLPSLLLNAFILLFLILSIFKKTTPYRPLESFTLFLFSAFVFGRQAFINYYYLIASLILLDLAVNMSQENNKSVNED
ncbi:hypothetical protein A3E42_02400 [Candidatus Gottesmanbacteria bacterium RIFCSPHIGHO2_12_FULL_40_13]|uniref:Glycosyltransferase RgtA/B/C/D-like domain-containing protein n=1 Tax=Candidatus Gottesmanbacteria bacterium RIFCSPHIGHO2_01_FULL_40_15 TaxID=1798376 RepID=A0A1F5Z0B9_9BACT|nr:MAG: hypothetical protein A2777_04750 [Candidatus Gottesmanbacteria bacterium RIFCSPHIGHO2_01_FULL_40_15]OGG24800.1 MAG: hypothetical protein A3E42_02400 [Candidatus Gottesmanbacteria bacterium RIFCSPHIGHO2_12_FULL_40_13]